MLVEFSVGNYRSFHAPVSLSMLAATKLKHPNLDANNIFTAPDGLPMLKTAAIYGANASGKSNLIRALSFMRTFVLRSSKESQAGEAIRVEPFRLSTATLHVPSYFQIVFELDGARYRYGFELDAEQVHTEWLYRSVKRESRLFVREGDEYDIASGFKEGRGLEQRTRPNALFLSVVAQWNGPLAIALLSWFRNGLELILGLNDEYYSAFTLKRCQTDSNFRQRVIALVQEADLGITHIDIEDRSLADMGIPEPLQGTLDKLLRDFNTLSDEPEALGDELRIPRAKTIHKIFDATQQVAGQVSFDLQTEESQGTQKFFYLAGYILDVLDTGKTLVIDEMEARLHPFLTRAIIALFNSPETNPKNAQLIFATHDTGLLSNQLFRRDQIWFTEKDRYGATDLYSLAEFDQPVRNDASYDKDYLAGKYGAIPFIGGLSMLFEVLADAQNA